MNRDKIKEIEFIFENCESATVPYKNISNFDIHINDENEVDNLTMTIKDDNNITGNIYDKIRPFARFNQHNDITSIHIHYKNSTEEHYYIVWDNIYSNENSFQHNNLVDAYTLNLNINTYKPRFPNIDIEEDGDLIHIDDKEMLKVYKDFVIIDKELLNEIWLKADMISLYDMINNSTQNL